jgi:hypothetical protein
VLFYSWNSPYAFSENRIIDAIELEGLEKWVVTHYRNQKGTIEKTIIKLYTEKEPYKDMKKGVGILYMNKIIDAAGNEKSVHNLYIQTMNIHLFF